MNIYHIRRVGNISHDEAASFVVISNDASAARKLIVDSQRFGDEGSKPWLDKQLSEARHIGITTLEPVIVNRDFNAG